jgi:hypothetical protein
MSYIPTGVESLTDSEKLDLIIKSQEDEARKRKLALTIGALGALIAAARLGIVALPLVKAARARPRAS